MIIFKRRVFSFLFPFKDTFKYLGKTGKSLIHGDIKGAGKNTIKTIKNAATGTGKLTVGVAGAGVGGTAIVSDQLNNSVNDRSSYITIN